MILCQNLRFETRSKILRFCDFVSEIRKFIPTNSPLKLKEAILRLVKLQKRIQLDLVQDRS